jgi:hypothetical protein
MGTGSGTVAYARYRQSAHWPSKMIPAETALPEIPHRHACDGLYGETTGNSKDENKDVLMRLLRMIVGDD